MSNLNIPITGQSFAVLLVGYALGRWKGLCSVALYILLGALGLPVFSKGAAGLAVLTGSSGGYLLGFLAGAFLVGYLAERGWRTSFWNSLLAMLLGTALILCCGAFYLAYLYGWSTAWNAGVQPFLIGGLIKSVLGAAVVSAYYYFSKPAKITTR